MFKGFYEFLQNNPEKWNNLSGDSNMKWYCIDCDLEFDENDVLQATCPRCGSSDYHVVPLYESQKKILMPSMTEEIMSAGVGLGTALGGFNGTFSWILIFIAIAAIQLAAIITKSEHYLNTKRLTIVEGKQFSLINFFLMGFARNLLVVLFVAGIVIFIRRLICFW